MRTGLVISPPISVGGRQRHGRAGCGNVEAELAGNAHGLQVDGAARAANQNIGTDAGAERGFSRCAW